MLTVDYDHLGLNAGDLVLDMGCGAGRHAYESFRRGARVVALDYSAGELKEVRDLFAALEHAGEAPSPGFAATVNGDALRLPFPDESFERVIASEVLEHIPDDDGAITELARVLKPGGTMAVTVPAWLSERICWALSDSYHAPIAAGGHVRIYTENELRTKLRRSGLSDGRSHLNHALHAPYWWLRCIVGPTDDQHPLVRAYHRLLVWDIAKAPRLTRTTEKLLNPVIGKSVVVYCQKPAYRTRPEYADDAA
ncbi:MAG: Ubiquinone/menaquinone biosynthesis C-methyltransferase UbiE [Acidimicrobiales bacterium]|nr:MAG: class I SAM-dependent methyltransferase [Actinomycetota bacterium]MBV6508520.1 Ubiquinone/menaquinone biosynthesis C-methyltransferase UbiE [Acidimicrobiales bacterium]RIK05163.1 MAG: SAM-dependent methyltransferase [Acidobacteriota bacterium]